MRYKQFAFRLVRYAHLLGWVFQDLPVCRPPPALQKGVDRDNLYSHLSTKVIDACRENNIEFVCLPPNATENMQQLDVGFFAQMKGAWHNQLWDYKQKDPNAILLRKTEFPKELKELVHGLPSAFHKCGLYPLNRLEVLNRIPASWTPTTLPGTWTTVSWRQSRCVGLGT
jgi:hypothetical protein